MVIVGAEQMVQELKNRIKSLQVEIEKKDKEIKRIKKLYSVKKTEQEIFKGQKMILFHFLGTLDSINEKIPAAGDKIKLLRFFIDANSKNIEKDFNGRGNHLDSPLSNVSNYTFLADLFAEYDMEEQRQKALKMIQDIKNYKKEKRKK